MTDDYILYIGENRDFSDCWLIDIIGKQTKLPVILSSPGKSSITFPRPPVLAINRLYTSSVCRYGKSNIIKSIKRLVSLEKEKIPLINSSLGYLIDIDRNKQCDFFSSHSIPYVKVIKTNSVLYRGESVTFPCVLKTNPSGRNKTLKIIINERELSLIPFTARRHSILQPLIKEKICYRTEFVGDWYATYPQRIYFQKDRLSFTKIYKIISIPRSKSWLKRVVDSMEQIGVYTFSIEYFVKKNHLMGIIDFNLTSNYHATFIKATKGSLENAWAKLINLKLWNSQKK